MNTKEQFLALCDDDDGTIGRWMKKTISEAGGVIPLKDLDVLFRKRFNFSLVDQVFDEDIAKKAYPDAFPVRKGIVHLI